MRSSRRIFLTSLVLLGAFSSARAEEEMLRGPHPFIKDNELSIHTGYSMGLGDNVRGLRVQGDYNYRLGQLTWLDIQMGMVSGSCKTNETVCSKGSGDAVEILAGATWKFRTKLPFVVYGRAAAGPTFVFPDSSRSAAGFLVRGGVGAHYFVYDWFGVGAEFTGAWGLARFQSSPHHTGSLGSMDANLGVALQF